MAEASWDDLQLFYVVAEAGGLAGAAQRTGISPPTIGRRMLGLERTLGRTLFLRSHRGYQLAHDGESLFERVKAMQAVANGISEWHGNAFALPIVTTAAERWLAPFMAENASHLRDVSDPYRLCCSMLEDPAGLSRRGTDVALMFERPKSGNLAVRPAGRLAYAIYRAAGSAPSDDIPWLSLGTEMARTAADRYVFEHHEAGIFTWTSDCELVPSLIANGAGRSILPVYLGDADPRLKREGGVIAEVTHPVFIVAHDDERHRSEVRTVMDRIAALLRQHEQRLCGIAPVTAFAAIQKSQKRL